MFGQEMENGEIPNNIEWVGKVIQDICFNNANNYFGFNVTEKKPDVKAAAQKLLSVVDAQARADMDAAAKSAAASKYRAYELYGMIAEQYAGYPIVSEATAARRALAGDAELRKEIVAIKAIDKQRALLVSDKPAVRERAIAAIQKIIAENPDSEAARMGREALKK